MTSLPENRLERSLMKAAQDPAYRPLFYRNFVESDLFIVQHGLPPKQNGTIVLKEGYELEIQNIDLNGKPYIPVFSSLTRLQAALQDEATYISLNALEFLKITQGAEIILNPGSDFGKKFTRDEIQEIIDGSIWKTPEANNIEKGTRLMIGQPANYPHELTEALSRLFGTIREVKRAYLAQILNPEIDEKPHTMIGIEVSGNWNQVMAQVGLVIRDIKIPYQPVDFIRITRKGEEMEDYLVNECEPFYKRKILGFF